MKKINLCILLLLGFLLIQSENLLAQDKKFEVKGTVTSADKKPLEGVNIRVAGGQSGTATDATGHYRILVDNGNVSLVYSYVGYASKTIAVDSKNVIDVALV